METFADALDKCVSVGLITLKILCQLPQQTQRSATELSEKRGKGMLLERWFRGCAAFQFLCANQNVRGAHMLRRFRFLSTCVSPQPVDLGGYHRDWKKVEKDIKISLALSSLCVSSRPDGKSKMLLSRVGSFQEIKQCVGQGESGFSSSDGFLDPSIKEAGKGERYQGDEMPGCVRVPC